MRRSAQRRVSRVCRRDGHLVSASVSRAGGYVALQKISRLPAETCFNAGRMERPDHVLIVDDDRDLRELLTTYLVKHGVRVTAAADGRQMQAALAAGGVDLIVLDLMLPGTDGLVLCRDLRARDHSTVPILMLTARSEEADRIVGLEMGADDYLTKPFAARELLARIRAVLRRTRMLPPSFRSAETARAL